MHTVKWFQVLLFSISTSFQHYSFVCTRLYGSMYRKWLNISIWSIDGTLTGTTTPGQSKPGSNGNEEVLYIPQSSRTKVSLSYVLVSYLEHKLAVGVVSYPTAEMWLAYSTAPPNWAKLELNNSLFMQLLEQPCDHSFNWQIPSWKNEHIRIYSFHKYY